MAKSKEQYIAERTDDYDTDVYTFDLVDAHTVERLARDGDIKLPYKELDPEKDIRWNTKQFASRLLQGILNGDPVPNIANNLLDVVGYNEASAMRNARTMTTAAENIGRQDSYEELADKGVVQKKVWIATPDDRTRASHLALDGEEVDVDEEFSNGCMYPADPDCRDGSEIYNCRCSMRDRIVGFRKADGRIEYVGHERDTTMHADQIAAEQKKRAEAAKMMPVSQAQAGKITRNYDTDFAKHYGQDFYDAMCDLIDKCGNESIKEVWQIYQGKIGAKDPNYKGRAYASAGSIHVNKDKDAKGSSWEAPHEVTFHESGHSIDFLTKNLADGSGIKLMYSSAYQNGAFPATIRDEVNALVSAKDKELKALFKEHAKDYEWLHEHGFISDYTWHFYETQGHWLGGEPKYSKSFAYKAVEDEIKAIQTRNGNGRAIGDISDMLEGSTDGRISCGYGHGKSYWKKVFGIDEKLATEAFAEMTSATIANGESLETIKKYLPKSYAMYNDMLKDIAQKGG